MQKGNALKRFNDYFLDICVITILPTRVFPFAKFTTIHKMNSSTTTINITSKSRTFFKAIEIVECIRTPPEQKLEFKCPELMQKAKHCGLLTCKLYAM